MAQRKTLHSDFYKLPNDTFGKINTEDGRKIRAKLQIQERKKKKDELLMNKRGLNIEIINTKASTPFASNVQTKSRRDKLMDWKQKRDQEKEKNAKNKKPLFIVQTTARIPCLDDMHKMTRSFAPNNYQFKPPSKLPIIKLQSGNRNRPMTRSQTKKHEFKFSPFVNKMKESSKKLNKIQSLRNEMAKTNIKTKIETKSSLKITSKKMTAPPLQTGKYVSLVKCNDKSGQSTTSVNLDQPVSKTQTRSTFCAGRFVMSPKESTELSENTRPNDVNISSQPLSKAPRNPTASTSYAAGFFASPKESKELVKNKLSENVAWPASKTPKRQTRSTFCTGRFVTSPKESKELSENTGSHTVNISSQPLSKTPRNPTASTSYAGRFVTSPKESKKLVKNKSSENVAQPASKRQTRSTFCTGRFVTSPKESKELSENTGSDTVNISSQPLSKTPRNPIASTSYAAQFVASPKESKKLVKNKSSENVAQPASKTPKRQTRSTFCAGRFVTSPKESKELPENTGSDTVNISSQPLSKTPRNPTASTSYVARFVTLPKESKKLVKNKSSENVAQPASKTPKRQTRSTFCAGRFVTSPIESKELPENTGSDTVNISSQPLSKTPRNSTVSTSYTARFVASSKESKELVNNKSSENVAQPATKTPKRQTRSTSCAGPFLASPKEIKESPQSMKSVSVVINSQPPSITPRRLTRSTFCAGPFVASPKKIKESPQSTKSDDVDINNQTLTKTPRNRTPSTSFTPKTPGKQTTPTSYVSPFVTVARGKQNAIKEYKRRMSKGGIFDESDIDTTAQHFRNLLEDQINNFTEICNQWINYKEANPLSESAIDMINVPVGQTRLLIHQKFVQFLNLIENFENKSAECLTTSLDLHGFWDLLQLQVYNINERFANLQKIRDNNWQEILPTSKVVNKRKLVKTKKKAQGSSKLRDAIKAARAKRVGALKKSLVATVLTPSGKFCEFLKKKAVIPRMILSENIQRRYSSPGLLIMKASAMAKQFGNKTNENTPKSILKMTAATSARANKSVSFNKAKDCPVKLLKF